LVAVSGAAKGLLRPQASGAGHALRLDSICRRLPVGELAAVADLCRYPASKDALAPDSASKNAAGLCANWITLRHRTILGLSVDLDVGSGSSTESDVRFDVGYAQERTSEGSRGAGRCRMVLADIQGSLIAKGQSGPKADRYSDRSWPIPRFFSAALTQGRGSKALPQRTCQATRAL
jgi:hypothetical protein